MNSRFKETLPWRIYFKRDGRPDRLERKAHSMGRTFIFTHYYNDFGQLSNSITTSF